MVLVTVGIPSLLRKSLKKTLQALLNQSEKDFEVLITYRGNLTKDIEEFEKELDIKFIEQKEGFFEEALNLILENANGKILLTTDDDAIPSKDWIKDHIKFHESHPEVGIASGEIEGEKWVNYPNELFQKFKGTAYFEEYCQVFKDYVGYLTKIGLSVDRDVHKGFEKTLAIAGVNMSIKKEVYSTSRVTPYSLRGSYNETILALQGIKRGHISYTFRGGKVFHLSNASLSRPAKDDEWKLKVEKYTLPFAVNFIFPLDMSLLEDFVNNVEGEAKIGLSLALTGIKEKYSPQAFRELLRKTINNDRSM